MFQIIKDNKKGPTAETLSTELYPMYSYAMPDNPVPIIDPNDLDVQHVLCKALPLVFVYVTTIESDATSA